MPARFGSILSLPNGGQRFFWFCMFVLEHPGETFYFRFFGLYGGESFAMPMFWRGTPCVEFLALDFCKWLTKLLCFMLGLSMVASDGILCALFILISLLRNPMFWGKCRWIIKMCHFNPLF